MASALPTIASMGLLQHGFYKLFPTMAFSKQWSRVGFVGEKWCPVFVWFWVLRKERCKPPFTDDKNGGILIHFFKWGRWGGGGAFSGRRPAAWTRQEAWMAMDGHGGG